MPAAVSLSQMVDLSLGTPEVGAVNFNVMHTLLHAIIKKLNISDYKTEINEHDRDFLATSKIRAKSTLSDADSGRGEDSEDGISEKSGVTPFRPTPYHRLELKVEKLAQQLEELNKLPSNVELFNRTTKSKGDSTTERPVTDMWQYMQIKKRVDVNEEGVGKLFSLIEDMMKEMKELKDANQLLQDQLKGLNVDDLKKRLGELEKITTDLNDKFSLLPTPEEFSQFVTWPALEDALKGIRDDLQPQERVVIEMCSQTEPDERVMTRDLVDNKGVDKQIMPQRQVPNGRSNTSMLVEIDNGLSGLQGTCADVIGDQYSQSCGVKQSGDDSNRVKSGSDRKHVVNPSKGSRQGRNIPVSYTDDTSNSSTWESAQEVRHRSASRFSNTSIRSSHGQRTGSGSDKAVTTNSKNEGASVSRQATTELGHQTNDRRQTLNAGRRQASAEGAPEMNETELAGRSSSRNGGSRPQSGGSITNSLKNSTSCSSSLINGNDVQKIEFPPVNKSVTLVNSSFMNSPYNSQSDNGRETRPVSRTSQHESLKTSMSMRPVSRTSHLECLTTSMSMRPVSRTSQIENLTISAQRKLRIWPSRPGSSRPSSRVSTPGPSEHLLDILEKLGTLDTDHIALRDRVDIIEEELKNKLDKSAIEGLGVPPELLEQIGKLKEQLDALANKTIPTTLKISNKEYVSSKTHVSTNESNTGYVSSKTHVSTNESNTEYVSSKTHVSTNELDTLDKHSTCSVSTVEKDDGGSLSFLSSIVMLLSKVRQSREENSSDTDPDIYSNDDVLDMVHSRKMSDSVLSTIQQRLSMLEDKFKRFQEVLVDDSAYQSDVSDLTGWLAQMENKIANNLTDINTTDDSEVSDQAEHDTKKPSVHEQVSASAPKKEVKKEPAEKKKKKKPREEVEERIAEEDTLKQEIDEILENTNNTSILASENTDNTSILASENTDNTSILASENTDNTSKLASDLDEAYDKIKRLAYTLNDQLHGLRDKVFLVDQELKRMAKGVEFALMRSKVAGMNDMDGDALTRAQQAIQKLQAEVEKLHHTTADIIDENKHRSKQIEDTLKYCDRLQQEKADKDYVQMEVDVKADKKSLEAKVNTRLFDQTTEEINRMIKEILDKLAGHDEDWKTAYSKLTEDIDGKLDRLELDPLKEWLESRLKALNDKLKRYQKNMDMGGDDDAAGIRKQLIQKFHCISCDRPVDMMPTGAIPSLPAQGGLPPTRSPRPYTTYELDQIRQHAKSKFAIHNFLNFERAIAEKQLATMKKSDLQAFLVHFKQDLESMSQEQAESFANPEVSDYYATPRPCGGSHTLTYPHKRNTKLTHLSHLFRGEEVIVVPATREDNEIQGADGHIYRGRPETPRHQKLEAKLPTSLGSLNNNNNNMSVHVRAQSPQPPQSRRPASSVMVTQRTRPMSARSPPSPRPSSAGQALQNGSRPQSAKVVKAQDPPETAQIPQAEFNDEPVDEVQATMEVNQQEPVEEQNIHIDVTKA